MRPSPSWVPRLLLAGGLMIALFMATRPPVERLPEDCRCEQARASDTFCERCGRGYLAGIEIPSEVMHDALDCHGHDYDPASIDCDECQLAIAEQGFCERDGRGFHQGQAWFSRLSYHVARGTRPARVDCDACAGVRGGLGHCDECGRDWVGEVVLRSPADFAQVARAYGAFEAALLDLERCELCAAARVVNGACPTCKLRYVNGVAQPLGPR